LVIGLGVAAFLAARGLAGTHSPDNTKAEERGVEPIGLEINKTPAKADARVPPSELLPSGHRALRIVSEPVGATVFVDGRRLERPTPVTIDLPPETERVWIRVALDGFVPFERGVEAGIGETRFVLRGLLVDSGPGAVSSDPTTHIATKRDRHRRRR
jgi:hypothetical protein